MQELNCNQVLALLTFFIENRLNQKLMQSVEYHLNICQNCREKYLNLRKIFSNYQDIKNKITESDDIPELSYKDKQYTDFKENLSAYIDNELDDNDNLRIRKIAIANTAARKDLESVLSIREMMQDSFEKTKNNFKTDYSESTINKVFNNIYTTNKISYQKIMPILLVIVCIFIFILLQLK